MATKKSTSTKKNTTRKKNTTKNLEKVVEEVKKIEKEEKKIELEEKLDNMEDFLKEEKVNKTKKHIFVNFLLIILFLVSLGYFGIILFALITSSVHSLPTPRRSISLKLQRDALETVVPSI